MKGKIRSITTLGALVVGDEFQLWKGQERYTVTRRSHNRLDMRCHSSGSKYKRYEKDFNKKCYVFSHYHAEWKLRPTDDFYSHQLATYHNLCDGNLGEQVKDLELECGRLRERVTHNNATNCSFIKLKRLLYEEGYNSLTILSSVESLITDLRHCEQRVQEMEDCTTDHHDLAMEVERLKDVVKYRGRKNAELMRERDNLMECNNTQMEGIEGLKATIKVLQEKLRETSDYADCVNQEQEEVVEPGDYFFYQNSIQLRLCESIVEDTIVDNFEREYAIGNCRKATWDEVFPKGQEVTVDYDDQGTMDAIIIEPSYYNFGECRIKIKFANGDDSDVAVNMLSRRD